MLVSKAVVLVKCPMYKSSEWAKKKLEFSLRVPRLEDVGAPVP